MKVEHVTGTSVETNNLPDVDAHLMEESKKLHETFAKYNRQLFLVGEMKSTTNNVANSGCVFFHVGQKGIEDDAEAFKLAIGRYYGRIDGYIRSMSNQRLGIGQIPPPQVEP